MRMVSWAGPTGYATLTISAPGYVTGSFSNVVIAAGATTTRDLALATAPKSACRTDTTLADFQAGTGLKVDLTTSPGEVLLVNAPAIDQQNTSLSTSGVGINVTTWGGQTFTPASTGPLTRADLALFCAGCTGTAPALTLSVRATSGSLPTGADLATATIPGNASGAGEYVSATFATPATVTAGTTYALILRPTANPSAGTYALTRSATNVYAGGQRISSNNSGATWTGQTTDTGFVIYVYSGYAPAGTFVSSVKDANPAVGRLATWGAFTASTAIPLNTTLKLQAAGANDPFGPFTFVGPDGTAATYFSSGATLSQFNGLRYLRYEAFLGSSNPVVTSALDDATICFDDLVPATSLVVSPATGTYGTTAALSAALSNTDGPLAGRAVTFTLNGAAAGSALTDASGTAAIASASLTGIAAGSYPTGAGAAFAGAGIYQASSGTAALTVPKAAQAIAFGALAGKVATAAPFAVSATGGASGNPVTFSTASTACSVTGTTVTLLGAGTCAIDANQAGAGNYDAAPQVTQSFTSTLDTQTVSFPAIAGFSWVGGSATVAATASSGLTVSYGLVSGPCRLAGAVLTATGPGTCVVSANQGGNAFYAAAPQVTASASVSKGSQSITFAALADRLATDPGFTVSATGGPSLSPVIFSTTSTACSVTGNAVTLVSAGSCAITASQAGTGSYDAAPPVTRTFTLALGPQHLTFPAIAGFSWRGGSAALTATASSGLGVVYTVLSGPCSVTGGTLTASGAGSCTVAADQPGDPRYAAAARVTGSVAVDKAAQAITFEALADRLATDPAFSPSAAGGASGNPVVFSTASTACSVTGTLLTILTPGSCVLIASQAGNADYLDATASQTFGITLAPQTITFPAIAAFGWSGGSATLAATASSGLPVSYSVVSGPCALSAGTLTASTAGSCTIAADQAGDVRTGAAMQVTATVLIGKAAQLITFAELTEKAATDALFTVSATGGASGTPVTFATTSTACSVAGATVTINAAGTCAITASQAGDARYEDAVAVTRSFTISASAQTITFPAVDTFAWNSGEATLSATASSGLPVSYTVLSGPCAVGGETLTATDSGTCEVAADQPGDARFVPAARVSQSVTVTGPSAKGGGCGCAVGAGEGGELGLLLLLGLVWRGRGRRRAQG